MFVIQFSSVNDLRDFMRAHSPFVLWYPLTKKSQNRRQKITLCKFVLLYVKVFLLSFYDFKEVKSIKIEQNFLNNGQSHGAKNNRSEHTVSQ